ncbi:bifunctional 4-hydroxy-2-oxoglutarate aldolase/2-dehydro-3-deoxy-phosphogluconate aldolase [Nakamurella leprariae]|uniref:Bifunctional 4-hydroxy-2-oxoglutarate aldolase/2-dehydro-3-deoxy-phosphogluconate aldolase n=1 Tax=Nakamurella leprariae TaxID=2803911 RepID=A0A938YDA7_9ACTN|nr:bifunctional 4-hydroxy-2-oxoglutarate aldolase/2-dehydro-3-deoxy-phosphogluconate aldolase [Nakamurella leprariae]MBM9468572.1 bifunctional 4-hydroxy-2-oxoglutarate aldolase/2-dehydro-3-deoxy-phosphogluconate aldolase [Nakamurella leprariae]
MSNAGLPGHVAGTGVVAILRSSDARHVERVAHTLVEDGITGIELTLTVPGALDLVPRLRAAFGPAADIGVGTVTSVRELEAAVHAGAQFVVSPTWQPEAAVAATELHVPFCPGVFSPTEALEAWQAGVAAVKLFPASTVGPGYLRQLLGPIPDLAVIPTGGVEIDDVEQWLRAGAVGVGLGGPLLGAALATGDVSELHHRAERLLAAVARGRQA